MTTTQIDHNAEKSRSYTVRRSLPGAVEGHDWSNRMAGHPVHVIARRNTANVAKGEAIQLLSTSNAGFAGITGMGYRNGEFVHLGSLGAYDVAC